MESYTKKESVINNEAGSVRSLYATTREENRRRTQLASLNERSRKQKQRVIAEQTNMAILLNHFYEGNAGKSFSDCTDQNDKVF